VEFSLCFLITTGSEFPVLITVLVFLSGFSSIRFLPLGLSHAAAGSSQSSVSAVAHQVLPSPAKLHLLVLRFFFRVWCCPRSAFLLRSRTHFLRSFVPVTAVCRPSSCLTNSLEQILFCLFPCSVCGSFLLRARQWRPEVWLPQEISVSDADCSSRLLCSTRPFGPSVCSAVQPSALAPRFVRPWSAPANPSVHVSSVLPF
jgi:hypothetical protein